MRLDHIVVTAPDLDAGCAWAEAALEVPLAPGGRHAAMSTHNRLLSLGADCYLEVIAPDPAAPPPGRPRWFDLDGRTAPGLTNWAVRTDDLGAALAAAPDGAGEPWDLARGDLAWRMGVTAGGTTPLGGAFPMILEWRGATAAERLPDAGCRLRALHVETPQADALRAALAFEDRRVRIDDAPALHLWAEIDTPAGTRRLG